MITETMPDTVSRSHYRGALWALLLPLSCNGLPQKTSHAAPDALTAPTDDRPGRFDSTSGEPESSSGIPVLVERFTVLEFGEATARTNLRNEGTGVLKYRLATPSPGLGVDPALAELAPGAEAVLRADVGPLAATERSLPVHIITTGGLLLWSIEIEAAPESGPFRGGVALGGGGPG